MKLTEQDLAAHTKNVVLPMFRTRAELYRWGVANDYGRTAGYGLSELENLAEIHDTALLIKPVESAIASTVKVILRADDSSGTIGDVIRGLLELHARICTASPPDTKKLVAWLIKFQFDGTQDFFSIDIVNYASALGVTGIARYENELDKIAATIPPGFDPDNLWDLPRSSPDEYETLAPHRHNQFVLNENAKRLAVLHGDIDKIIELHGGDQTRSYKLEDTARALAEIGETDRAIEFAERGTFINDGVSHQREHCARYWCELLAFHRFSELLDARIRMFELWPTESNASALHKAAGTKWDELQDQVLTTLAQSPSAYIGFLLRTLSDVQRAWIEAQRLGLKDEYLWQELVNEYKDVDGTAVVPVIQRLVESDLQEAGVRNYRSAVKRLKQLKTVCKKSGLDDTFEDYVAQLREQHCNRPRFITELAKAKLVS